MKPLYEISNEYLTLYNNIDNETEDFDFISQIQNIEGDFESKAINIVSVIKNLEIDFDCVNQVSSKLDAKKKSLNKKIENLREYLKFNMEKIKKLEIKNSLHSIKIATNPPSVKVLDEALIPDEYITHQDIVKPDLLKIKNDLKLGVVIDGTELQQGTRVVIK